MLKQRVLTAIVLAPLIIALVFLTSTVIFAALLGVIFLAGLWEWTRMSGMHNRPLRACLLLGYAIVMVVLWPVVASNSERALARMRAIRVRSISKNDVTCAAVRRAATICSLVRRRI